MDNGHSMHMKVMDCINLVNHWDGAEQQLLLQLHYKFRPRVKTDTDKMTHSLSHLTDY